MTRTYYKFHEKKISEIEEVKNFIYDYFTSRKDSVLNEIPKQQLSRSKKVQGMILSQKQAVFLQRKGFIKKI